MVKSIRIHVEGGGDWKKQRELVRKGFRSFLAPVLDKARVRRIKTRIVASGSRNSAYDDFCTAVRTYPDDFNVLLVDAEGPVVGGPWDHLRERDRWKRPDGVTDEHCHLMVQLVEAWLVADEATLKRYYGKGFLESALPKRDDIEAVPKGDIVSALDRATKGTDTKGGYQKIRHCSDLLAMLDAALVRRRARHCERLFASLDAVIGD